MGGRILYPAARLSIRSCHPDLYVKPSPRPEQGTAASFPAQWRDPRIFLLPFPRGGNQSIRCSTPNPHPSILLAVRIHLLYFGMLKDLFGGERDTLELPQGACVEDALHLLRAGTSHPRAAVQGGIWESLAVAVNREYAGASTLLHDADELALLPPVSGGLDRQATDRNPLTSPTKAELRFQ